jgi:DNA-binding PadR family transcriptional regulator
VVALTEGKEALGEGLKWAIANSLDIILLAVALRGPFSGFDIIKDIAREFEVIPSQGIIYPHLRNMEEKGYLESKRKGLVREYSLTEKGREFARTEIEKYLVAYERISGLLRKVVTVKSSTASSPIASGVSSW